MVEPMSVENPMSWDWRVEVTRELMYPWSAKRVEPMRVEYPMRLDWRVLAWRVEVLRELMVPVLA